LYALQKAEGYPSMSTLRRRKPIPQLSVSIGVPRKPGLTVDNVKHYIPTLISKILGSDWDQTKIELSCYLESKVLLMSEH
jgi:hypothetical protein